MLIGIVVFASVLGAAWAQWERVQHDLWLRLLARARKRLSKAGIDSLPSTSPRQLAEKLAEKLDAKLDAKLDSKLGSKLSAGDSEQIQALRAWLMQLEMQRYASGGKAQASPRLEQLRRQFKSLTWPA